MEKLPANRGDSVRKLVETRGVTLRFLAPDSPDLNLIELTFAKLKTLIRKAAEPTVGALRDRIGQVLDAFTPQECANYLRHFGYVAA